MPPKFLYFDLGNVLMTFSNERMCHQMARVAGVSEQTVHDLLYPRSDTTDPQWQFEAGAYSEDAYYGFFCKAVGREVPRAQLELAAADMFAPIVETHDLAERLHARGCRLGLLSNTNAWHWKFLLKGQFPVLNRAFEQQVTSFEAQSMKPDARVYQLAIEKAGVGPGEIFFTDDKQENVDGARAVGMDGVLFTSTGQLIDELRTRGIETG